MDESKVTMKGRLGPGMMIAVDLTSGQVCTPLYFGFAGFHCMIVGIGFICDGYLLSSGLKPVSKLLNDQICRTFNF